MHGKAGGKCPSCLNGVQCARQTGLEALTTPVALPGCPHRQRHLQSRCVEVCKDSSPLKHVCLAISNPHCFMSPCFSTRPHVWAPRPTFSPEQSPTQSLIMNLKPTSPRIVHHKKVTTSCAPQPLNPQTPEPKNPRIASLEVSEYHRPS